MARKTSPALAKIWIRRKEIDKWPIKKICEVYGISRSTFYRWYNKYKSGELTIGDTFLDLEELAKDLEDVEMPSYSLIYYDRFRAISSQDAGLLSSRLEGRALERRLTHESSLGEHDKLPSKYDMLYLYLLPRDPYWAFAYWEVPESYRAGLRKLILRILDVSEEKPHLHFDVDVGQSFIGKWYLPIGIPGREFMAQLLGVTELGEYREIVVSNKIYLPRDSAVSVDRYSKRLPVSHDLELKVDWAISSLADYLSSYYFWF